MAEGATISGELVYTLAGGSLLLAVVLPYLLQRIAISAPMVLVTVGAGIGLLPAFRGVDITPMAYPTFTLHLTEVCVLVSLMGVGLALDRPLELRSWKAWTAWGATWRLLLVAMPLCIIAVAVLGWWAMGVAPATAVLIGAALAPTDPVLASDVQVGGPTGHDEVGSAEDIDERDEVRFALTSEAGLNDGLAFPFVYLALLGAAAGGLGSWVGTWVAWYLIGKVVIGALVGVAVGWLLARVAFRSRVPSLRMAETGEPLLALAAVFLTYGLAEIAGGYGFLSVFACAMTLRSAERGHGYHRYMHEVVERLERLLTLVVLLLLGVALTNGLLDDLTWPAAAVGVGLVLVVRPITGWVALVAGPRHRDQVGSGSLGPRERLATAFFGVRGVGSLYYIAYATGEGDFGDPGVLWSMVGFTVAVSVLVHGVTATPAMTLLDRSREARASRAGDGERPPAATQRPSS